MRKYILSFFLLLGLPLFAQNAEVVSLQIDESNKTAQTNAVKDFDGNYCALLIVFIDDSSTEFRGDFLGAPQVKEMEYDLWMMDGAQRIEVMPSSTLPLSITFSDYGIESLKGQSVYVLKISTPSNGDSTGAKGSLKVDYKPIGADIYVDGKKEGQSPSLIKGLSNGKHTLEIRAQGYRSYSEEIDVKNNLPIEVNGNLDLEFNVNGATFDIVLVDGGTFLMGATPEQGEEFYDDEKPIHKVTLSSYGIGKTEVTHGLWTAIMGDNTGWLKDIIGEEEYNKTYNSEYPERNVTKNEAISFCRELSRIAGRHFRLPSEAEWEFAARGGIYGKGYRYSGSDNLDEVAWYGFLDDEGNNISNCEESVHPVGTKKPNELGIYDMTGSVAEFVQDMPYEYSNEEQTNPLNRKPIDSLSDCFITRGGPCVGYKEEYRNSSRGRTSRWFGGEGGGWQDFSQENVGFRIVLDLADYDFNISEPRIISRKNVQKQVLPNGNEEFTIGDVSFEMVSVVGGNATMQDGTSQRLYDYFIGQTEVTQELWDGVMGENENLSGHLGKKLPVENVSWQDTQYFIEELNKITGCKFRLPTEAEWDFAACGGTQSRRYMYSGSDNLDEVAWYDINSNRETHPVGTRKPNELGIYDMSGNVMEWIWHPDVAEDTSAPLFGGAYHQPASRCTILSGNSEVSTARFETIGFRLAMDVDNALSNMSLVSSQKDTN